MRDSTALCDSSTPTTHVAAQPVTPVLRSRRLLALCLAIGLATAASVFAGSMAVAQSGVSGQVIVVRTMYAGHDGHASCPGIAEIKADVGDQVTYCYELTNSSAAPLDRPEFVDPGTGADTSFMSVAAGSLPVAANGTVTWAFQTRATTSLAGPAPTPTAEPTATATPAPTATAQPSPTKAPAATATAIPTATVDPTAIPADPTAIPADPTAIPADPTAIPADPTAIPVAPSAPAPPAASSDASIMDAAAVVGDQASENTMVVEAVEAAPALTPSIIDRVAEEATVVPQSDRTSLIPIATSSGWRLGNTTVAMVLSVLIAVVAGLVAGMVFWRFARHLQHRRSAFYWYERLAVMEA